MTRRLITAIAISLCLALTPSLWAQEKTDSEKTVLLKKLFGLMNLKALVDATMASSMEEMGMSMQQGLREAWQVESATLSPQKRAEFERELTSFSKRITGKIVERMQQKSDIEALTVRLMLPVYEKEFSISEIKDMIVFYESPTGQKMVKAMPNLMQDMTKRAITAIEPIVKPLVEEIMLEEKESFEKLTKLAMGSDGSEPPPPPPPAPKARKPVKKR